MGSIGSGLAALAVAAAFSHAAAAQDARPGGRMEARCARYAAAATELTGRWRADAIGRAFREAHAAFIASGCAARIRVCPRSPAELDLADALTVAAMNAGAPSSFLPFACPP